MGISSEGLHETSPDSQALIRWSGIEHIGVTTDHAFFFVTQKEAHVLPRRAFPDAESFEHFVDLAVTYHERQGREPAPRSEGIIAALPTRPTDITTSRTGVTERIDDN